jgi:hypothetical protein
MGEGQKAMVSLLKATKADSRMTAVTAFFKLLGHVNQALSLETFSHF